MYFLLFFVNSRKYLVLKEYERGLYKLWGVRVLIQGQLFAGSNIRVDKLGEIRVVRDTEAGCRTTAKFLVNYGILCHFFCTTQISLNEINKVSLFVILVQ